MADDLTTPIPDGTIIATKEISAGKHAPKKVLVDTAGAEVIGLVTASPTANTVLARLKDLLTGIILAAGTAVIGKVDHSSTGIGHGVTTVTTAGTDVVLAGSTAAKWVTVQAQTDNTGWIAVGATGVDATEATGTGVLLDAGESVTLPIDNLADVFIDSTVNGEGVRYTYGT